jgi:hypothetical protein
VILDEIAEEIHRDLDAPSSTSQGLIKFWLRENIGLLNNLLTTDFMINLNDYEIYPSLDEKQKVIYKKLYMIDYYDGMIRKNVGASAFNAIVEVTSDGATVRKVQNTNVANMFIQLKKNNQEELIKLINAYNSPGNIIPKQVTGDDTESASPTDE